VVWFCEMEPLFAMDPDSFPWGDDYFFF